MCIGKILVIVVYVIKCIAKILFPRIAVNSLFR